MLSSILLLGAVALSSSVLAAPSTLEPRAASITCQRVSDVYGYFVMTESGSTAYHFAGWNTTYTLANAIQAVGSSADAGSNPSVVFESAPFSLSNTNFGFQGCASTAMGYAFNETASNAGVPKFYGQIYSTTSTSEKRCVTRHYVDYGHEFLTLEPCLTADDANLTLQYFRVTQTHVEYQANRWSIQNVGHPKGTSGKIYYWGPGVSKMVAPAWRVYPETPTAYSLEFRDIHIN